MSESYMHRAAKTVLTSWLRNWAGRSCDLGFQCDAYRGWAPFSWRVNRGGPHYGVWEEWPIFGSHGVTTVWDETAWPWDIRGLPHPYGAGWQENEADSACLRLLNERPPTYDECLRIGMPPSAILDVAIQHKGALGVGIEVVHRHGVSERKLACLQRLRAYGVEIYTVPAEWILRQVGVPSRFKGERIV